MITIRPHVAVPRGFSLPLDFLPAHSLHNFRDLETVKIFFSKINFFQIFFRRNFSNLLVELSHVTVLIWYFYIKSIFCYFLILGVMVSAQRNWLLTGLDSRRGARETDFEERETNQRKKTFLIIYHVDSICILTIYSMSNLSRPPS